MASVSQLLALAGGLPSDSARLDAELLLGHCLQKPRSYLYAWPEAEVDQPVETAYRRLLTRREAGEPVAYLTGSREFWSLELMVNRHTLVPRPETETLVEWTLDLGLPDDARVADLGTGSGAIALALASERAGWSIVACDASREALVVASANRDRLGAHSVTLVRSDWGAALPASSFHAIVSNPPYIAVGDPHLERGDVAWEPGLALRSGVDGLDAIRVIVAQATGLLLPGGWLLLEHGFEQAERVRGLLQEAGFECVGTREDLSGQPRITGGQWHDQ